MVCSSFLLRAREELTVPLLLVADWVAVRSFLPREGEVRGEAVTEGEVRYEPRRLRKRPLHHPLKRRRNYGYRSSTWTG